MVPDRRLLSRWSVLRLDRLRRVLGIVPVRLLLSRLRSRKDFTSLGSLDVIGGIGPVSWLSSRYRYTNFGMLKKLCGILPDILLPPTMKYDISVRLLSGVKYPSRLLDDK